MGYPYRLTEKEQVVSDRYIGLMSGTSMDAIDAVLIDFADKLEIVSTHSLKIPDAIRTRISALCLSGADEIERMGRLDRELGHLFAQAAKEALDKAGLAAGDVKAIGSHGQTIRHRPSECNAFTLQIADPNTIAEETGILVVADFRRRDMAAGGQGAPLVPSFHAAIFGHKTTHRIVLNLGGIANITVLAAGRPESTYGFDTGPANTLMDQWALRHLGQPIDTDGAWAASGSIEPALLTRLLQHPFFALTAPKSTGREDFHLPWLEGVLADFSRLPPENVQATLLELTAISVSDAVKTSKLGGGELLVCGGGAFNPVFINRLKQLLPQWALHSTADFGLAPNWVEASAFAWLARQTLLGLPGNLPAVTGAAGPRVLGGIYPA